MKKGFIDETAITVTGGGGGNGIVSFLRERGRPWGGPNGGDGGGGGDVYITADGRIKTLLELGRRRRIAAGRGRHGQGSDCCGAAGKDAALFAPIGTRICDLDTGQLHADLVRDGEKVLLARGGRGGLGNSRFKSSTNRAPRRATEGEAGEERRFSLELRILADVGLFGMPNAGKSSLLRALSAAKPKVAPYPFTTLSPQLGVIDSGNGASVTVADVPGLIGGAAQGAGLGNRFLRHLARTALLCQVVDISVCDPAADCLQVQKRIGGERFAVAAQAAVFDFEQIGHVARGGAAKARRPHAAAVSGFFAVLRSIGVKRGRHGGIIPFFINPPCVRLISAV